MKVEARCCCGATIRLEDSNAARVSAEVALWRKAHTHCSGVHAVKEAARQGGFMTVRYPVEDVSGGGPK